MWPYINIKKMKNLTLIISFLIFYVSTGFGQTTSPDPRQKKIDSVKEAYLDGYAIRYPILRQGSISTDVIGSANTNSLLYGNPLFTGKVSIVREKANFNIPLTRWGKNSLVASINYINQHFDIDHVQSFNPRFPVQDSKFDKAAVGFSVSYSRADSLFNKAVIYSGTVSGFTDQLSAIQRVNYIGSIVFPLSHTATTSYTLGLVVIIDPSTPSPVLPVFSYWHKFQASDLELYVDLPTRISLRKQLSPKSWASFGTELGGTFSFLSLNNQSIVPQDDTYSTLELKTGPTFEYMVSKKIIFGVTGGMFSTLTSRVFKRNTSANDYFIRNNNSSTPFVNFTISFLPFFRTNK
jgi:hypothetical protein